MNDERQDRRTLMPIPDFNALHLQLGDLSRRGSEATGDARDKLDDLAYGIGKTIAALAGIRAMHAAFDHVEIHVGEREAVWLSRRWAGITDPEGMTWG
jgi:hypothetical protein